MTTIKLRRGTSAQWASANPVLAEGEPGLDTTLELLKVGDGVTAWASLPAAQSGSYAPRRQPVGHAVIGDSISSFQSVYGQSWHRQIPQLSQQRIRYRGDSTSGGYTLEQGESLLLPALLAIDPAPQVCTIALGTNNTGDAGYSFATSKATHQRIIAALEAGGITPGLWTLPPRDDSATVRGHVERWNAYIYEMRAAYGFPIVDAFGALADPADGLYLTAYRLDSVHPNRAGQVAIALRAMADTRFSEAFRHGGPPLSLSPLTDVNKAPSGGLFLVDTNADGLSDGYSKVGTVTLSRPAASVGTAQRTSIASGGSSAGGFWRADISITPGNTYEISAVVTVDLEPLAATGATAGFGGYFRGSGANIGEYVWCSDLFGVSQATVAHRRVTAPAGADTLRLDFTLSGTTVSKDVTSDVSQFRVADVTGLTA